MTEEVKAAEVTPAEEVRTLKYHENGVVKEANIEDVPEEHLHGITRLPANPGPAKRVVNGVWVEIPLRFNKIEGRFEEDEAQAVPVSGRLVWRG